MKKLSIVVALVTIMLVANGCSEGVEQSEQSKQLQAQYEFYEDSIKSIKTTMDLSQEEADNVFTLLVSECGIDEEMQNVSKYGLNDEGVYNVWSGWKHLIVTIKDGEVDTVKEGSEQIYPKVHKNLLMQASVKTAEVKNGFGTETIGERAYIKISKEDLKQTTQEDYKEFAETVVKDSGYNWFSIMCDDNTGVCFIGSMSYVAEYGKMNEEGGIDEVLGDILLRENGEYAYEERK